MRLILFACGGILLPSLLCAAGLYFFFYMNGKPFRGFFTSLRGLSRKDRTGQSPWKAASMALAGTLGVGNIVGVAAAIKEGGAGVLFWMWLSAGAAMVVKYAEILLSMNHRQKSADQTVGGAMYYMKKPCSTLFAVLCCVCALGVGCVLQVRAITDSFSSVLGTPPLFICLLLFAIMVCCLLKKGSKLFDLTALIVPFMTLLYVVLCLCVLFKYCTALPDVLAEIIRGAFSFKSTLLGSLSATLTILRLGIVRGILSNEAGCGTAPMAHAASCSKSAAAQGALGVLEVAVDTLLLCSLTGFAVLVCPQARTAASGGEMVLRALSAVFGKGAQMLYLPALFFFVLATLICWAFYAKQSVSYLTRNSLIRFLFMAIFCLFILLAPCFSGELLWQLSDGVIACMTLLNLHALFAKRKEIRFLSMGGSSSGR